MSRWKLPTRTLNNSPQPITVEVQQAETEKSQDKDGFFPPVSGNKIYFYSDVTKESIYILNRQIDEMTKHLRNVQICYNLPTPPEIELVISSDGGEVFSAFSAVDRIINNSIPINTHCEGFVASAATLLSVVGKRRTISPNGIMLVHQVSSEFWGNYSQFQDEMKNLDVIMKMITSIYKKYTKFEHGSLTELLKHELNLTPEECINYGLVDSISK
jgi:ATP-dependent protease ClpP protease subunit